MNDLGLEKKTGQTPDGADIAYWLRPGERPFVLLHGLGYSAQMWRGVISHLPREAGVLAIDIRGHGESTLGIDPPAVDLWARDALLIARHEKLDSPAVCGLSMGGYTTLAIAAAEPDYARAYGLISTASTADDRAGRLGRVAAIQTLKTLGARGFCENLMPKLLYEEHPEIEAQKREAQAEFERAGAVGLAFALQALGNRPDRLSLLPNIQQPCAVVVGDKDILTPPAKAEQTVAGLSNATLTVIEGVGHMSAIQNPQAVAAAIAEL